MCYGFVAIISTNLKLCSLRLPEAVAILLYFHTMIIIGRAAFHVAFPLYRRYWSNMNPIGPLAEKVSLIL
jgi:hypothetical protein